MVRMANEYIVVEVRRPKKICWNLLSWSSWVNSVGWIHSLVGFLFILLYLPWVSGKSLWDWELQERLEIATRAKIKRAGESSPDGLGVQMLLRSECCHTGKYVIFRKMAIFIKALYFSPGYRQLQPWQRRELCSVESGCFSLKTELSWRNWRGRDRINSRQ